MYRVRAALALGLLLAFILILPSPIHSFSQEIFQKVTHPIRWLSRTWLKSINSVLVIPKLHSENEELKKQLDLYRSYDFELKEVRMENSRFRDLLDFQERVARRLRSAIAAEVIGRSPIGWQDTIIVNKGRQDGIREGSPVMTTSGLLGVVAKAKKTTSNITLLSHPRFRLGAIVQRTRDTGVLYGTVDGEVRMKYLSTESDVQIGDYIQTAGYSKDVPKGLFIGKIVNLWKEPGQIYQVAEIQPAVDFNRLEEVICVTP